GGTMPERTNPLFWKTSAPWPAQEAKPDHWGSYAVVDGKWKLVTNKDASHAELYDIAASPFEKEDLAEENSDVVEELLSKIEAWKKELPEKPSGDVFSGGEGYSIIRRDFRSLPTTRCSLQRS